MGITKESALDMKRTALAVHEAEQHLRTAGDTTEGVVEAAAADVLDKRAAYEDACEKAKGEHDLKSGDAPHTSETATPSVEGEDGDEATKEHEPEGPDSETEIEGRETGDPDKTGDGDDKNEGAKSKESKTKTKS